ETPLTLFAKVAGEEKHAFLFESMEGGEKWGRYSFIGLDPLVTFTSRGDQVTLRVPDHEEDLAEIFSSNPLDELKRLLQSFNAVDLPGMPRFYGGAVGFLGYDMVRCVEKIPCRHPEISCPDSGFMVPRLVLIHDAVQQTLTIVCNVMVDGKNNHAVEELYHQGCARIDDLIVSLRNPVRVQAPEEKLSHDFSSNMSRDDFMKMVEAAREYILAGDIIQVVLSQRFHTTTILDPFLLYRALRHINPSPYLFYLRHEQSILIGSSPEILVRLEQGEIELRPIAGTRKRGRTEAEDLALEQELLADPKERAEHLMLVDLGRNDVGRVAESGSVEVTDLLVIERYSHVMHIVSGVRGRLAEGMDQFDVMKACFPAGTVSGAPKIRAMEIIDELEVERRGPYAGAVGYFGFSGNMDFCIAIRTFVLQENDADENTRDLYIQAGAGIVADSDPVKEYEETLNKAKGLRRAVELIEKGM
ncbi:MAG TPA: anthranilate synthase component I, partial [Desulfobulbaceae bacterium]|nr:anthranilate synthase component I [Desulfobulbaceae bacterium]